MDIGLEEDNWSPGPVEDAPCSLEDTEFRPFDIALDEGLDVAALHKSIEGLYRAGQLTTLHAERRGPIGQADLQMIAGMEQGRRAARLICESDTMEYSIRDLAKRAREGLAQRRIPDQHVGH